MRNLILDLDSTLIYTRDEEEEDVTNREAIEKLSLFTKNHHLRKHLYYFECSSSFLFGAYRPGLVTLRPPLTLSQKEKENLTFVDFSFKYFDNVFVWSAGNENYVDCISTSIFKRKKKDLTSILSREDCIIDESNKTTKRLEYFFEGFSEKDGINESNTIIIDDNEDTFRFNKKNAIHIPEFKPIFTTEYFSYNNTDDALFRVMDFFLSDEFTKAEDVRDVDKKKIFSKKR